MERTRGRLEVTTTAHFWEAAKAEVQGPGKRNGAGETRESVTRAYMNAAVPAGVRAETVADRAMCGPRRAVPWTEVG